MSKIAENIDAVCELIKQKVQIGFGISSQQASNLKQQIANLEQTLVKSHIFPADWVPKHSIGVGNLASVMWIVFLPPGQSTQDGIYVSLCFGKAGNGLVTGCAISNTSKKKYSYVPTVNRPDPRIDVDGTRPGTHYNDGFVNPLEVFAGSVDEIKLLNHIKASIKECEECLNMTSPSTTTTNSTPLIVSSGEQFDQSALEAFQDAVKDSGLQFDDVLEKRFIAALCAKPFVILSGLSGSGKTKLTQAFVSWIANKATSLLVPIGADWTNSEKLLGYPNALDEDSYAMPDTGVLKLLMDAEKNPKQPFFLILDEMNLSHVERYFADFLSSMESGDEIKLYDGDQRYADKAKTIAVPRRIRVPKNLFVIGTMNVDETTYMFSPKVLDRAQVIEFRVKPDEMAKFVGFDDNGNWNGGTATKIDLGKLADPNGIGKGAKYAESFLELALKRDEKKPSNAAIPAVPENQDAGKVPLHEVAKAVNAFFKPLAELGAEFGYRSAAEIMSFCGFYIDVGAKIDDAIDAAIVQKLLPKLHGSQNRLGPILDTLIEKSIKKVPVVNDPDAEPEIRKIYELTYEKLMRMKERVEKNGFTSFTEA